MKICQIYENFIAPPKDSMGAERVCESITKGLLSLGHEVVMKLHPDSKKSVAPLVEEIPEDCDILHFHQWEPGKIDYEKYGKPWIVTLHGGGSETDPQWIKATKENPNVVCVSKYIADKVGALAWVWTCSDEVEFIYDPYKSDYFLWMAGTDWGEGKGLWSTIQLAKKLRFKLKIAGSGQNQANIEQIKKLCDDKIEYIGSVNGFKKAEILAKAKALILLTRLNDACPTTVSEAMLSGTPVIASNMGAMPEIVFDGQTGYVCKTETDIVRAIMNIEKINPQFCYARGKTCFTSTAAAQSYLRIYENMLDFGTVSPR